MIRYALLLALVVGSGCDSGQDAAESEPIDVEGNVAVLDDDVPGVGADGYDDYVDQREALLARLDALIGDAEASDIRACLLLPVGRTVCGVENYRAFSRESANAREVIEVASELAALDVLALQSFGRQPAECAARDRLTLELREGQCLLTPVTGLPGASGR